MLTVIAYDIVDDRRREAISTFLATYGLRVNYSVFECELNRAEYTAIHTQLTQLIDARTDRIVLYRLCEGCRTRKAALGRAEEDTSGPRVVIV